MNINDLLNADLTFEVNRTALADALAKLERLEEVELLKTLPIDDIVVVNGTVVSFRQNRLESLKMLAQPLRLGEYFAVTICGETRDIPRIICDSYGVQPSQVRRLYERRLFAAMQEESRTHRVAGADCYYYQRWDRFHETSLGRRMAFLAWPEIAQWIREDDARRLSEYDEFRKFVLGDSHE